MYKMSDALGYYKVLEVAEDADAETIKRQYHDLAKRWHPDYNQDTKSTDIFQKISRAYEVLSDSKNRQIYDIFSLVYNAENYPDLEVLSPLGSDCESTEVRVVSLAETIAWGFSFKHNQSKKIVNFSQALKLNLKTALVNWLLGWWHPKAFYLNVKGLIYNFKHPIERDESLKVLLHNMVAYARENKFEASYLCGIQAKKLLTKTSLPLEIFLSELNIKKKRSNNWSLGVLKIVQLIVPVSVGVVIGLNLAAAQVKESPLWQFFTKSQKIDYYQKVNLGEGQSVDDVVVGRILSIPVDKTDTSKLYHVTQITKVMYGPSDEFDIIKTIKENVTVRLTGITPDNIWARIMIDNGEVGFVHFDILKQGIGKEIPFGSALIE